MLNRVGALSNSRLVCFLRRLSSKTEAASTNSEDEEFETFKNDEKDNASSRTLNIDFLLKNTDERFWIRTPVDLALAQAQNLDQLLNSIEKYRLSGQQCVSTLVLMQKFRPKEPQKLHSDARFQACLNQLINEPADSMQFGQWSLAFRCLLNLGFPVNHSISEKLRGILITLLNKGGVATSSLIRFACFYADFDTPTTSALSDKNDVAAATSTLKSKTKSEFMTSLEKFITSRLSTTSNHKNALLVMDKLCGYERQSLTSSDGIGVNGSTLALTLAAEDKCRSMAEIMSTDELLNTLKYSCAARRRNIELLKAIISTLQVRLEQDHLTIGKIILLLSYLNQLNYFSTPILERICEDCLREFDDDNVKKASGVSELCVQLSIGAIRCPNITERIAAWFLKNYSSCTSAELTSFVIMLARCNFIKESSNSAAAVQPISELLNHILADGNAKPVDNAVLLLDYVLSLAVLERLTPGLAESVLNRPFLDRLLSSDSIGGRKNVKTKLKCLNVNAAAKLDLNGYEGPSINAAENPEFFADLKVVPRKQKAQLIDNFSKSLFLLAPQNTYCKTNYICEQGHMIDAVVYLDSDGKPAPVKAWKGPESASFKKIAFLILDYHDMTQITSRPIGHYTMAARHLRKMGYSVSEMTWSDLSKNTTVLEGLNYLKHLFEMVRNEALSE